MSPSYFPSSHFYPKKDCLSQSWLFLWAGPLASWFLYTLVLLLPSAQAAQIVWQCSESHFIGEPSAFRTHLAVRHIINKILLSVELKFPLLVTGA